MSGSPIVSRREMLRRSGTGLGMLGLAGLLADAGQMGTAHGAGNPLAPRATHFPARVKHVIHIYLNGGPSQIDTFDPKPLLKKFEGKTLPQGNLTTERPTGAALPSPFTFTKHGKSGIEVSEIFPRTAAHADEICFIRSM